VSRSAILLRSPNATDRGVLRYSNTLTAPSVNVPDDRPYDSE